MCPGNFNGYLSTNAYHLAGRCSQFILFKKKQTITSLRFKNGTQKHRKWEQPHDPLNSPSSRGSQKPEACICKSDAGISNAGWIFSAWKKGQQPWTSLFTLSTRLHFFFFPEDFLPGWSVYVIKPLPLRHYHALSPVYLRKKSGSTSTDALPCELIQHKSFSVNRESQ